MKAKYVIGVDFGTDSVRAVTVNALTGEEVASSVFSYPRWRDGLYCDPVRNKFRQHPLDYIEGLEYTVKRCMVEAGPTVAQHVCGISMDTTGSTPVAVDKQGTPLALLPEFDNDPNAMFILWKDHTAVAEAAQINTHTIRFETDYLKYVGGIYSSEWYWAKLLYILRNSPGVRRKIYTWVEHCDWIPFLLTGGKTAATMRRSVCSAGHKALWAAEFNGYPPNDFFASLDPLLDGFVNRLPARTYQAAEPAGTLCEEWAEKLGLDTGVIIGIGAFDCHMGAVGGQIKPYYLSKVIGTSTCDIMVAPYSDMEGRLVKGICGQVDGSVIPGMIGLEAGQSAFGDAYAWLKSLLEWPFKELLQSAPAITGTTASAIQNHVSNHLLDALSNAASEVQLSEDDEFALDWLNGRRTPNANHLLKGAFRGLGIGTDAPRMFRAMAEATVFGAKSIIDCFVSQGLPIQGIIALGGIPRKSPFIMQLMADITGIPINVHRSEQTCAIGAAMFAATVAGIYPRVEEAMEAMGQGFDKIYRPDPANKTIYKNRYAAYRDFGKFVEAASNSESLSFRSR